MSMVMEEDEKIKEHLVSVEKKVLDNNTELQETIWGIEDTQAEWDTNIDQINQSLLDRAEKQGITRNQYHT